MAINKAKILQERTDVRHIHSYNTWSANIEWAYLFSVVVHVEFHMQINAYSF